MNDETSKLIAKVERFARQEQLFAAVEPGRALHLCAAVSGGADSMALLRVLLAVLPERIYFGMMKYEKVILVVMLAAVWSGVLDGPLSVMNSVVWDLLDNGTQYIDTIAYSAYYASAGAVI